MIELEKILEAQKRSKPFLRETPLIHSQYLSLAAGADVYLKLESLQPTRSFKVRGAFNKLRNLDEKDRKRPLVVASAGNHGLGVAYAAKLLGFSNLTVFVPENCPKSKYEKLQRQPINLRRKGGSYDEAVENARLYQAACDGIWISAYDDLDIIAGQGTIGLEILKDLDEVDQVIVPVGGGGLIAGIASSVKALRPAAAIIGVQPVASPSAVLSFQKGEAVDPYDHEPTIADGLAGGFGKLPFRVARNLINQTLLITEEEIRNAVTTLLFEDQIVAEPSGAIAIAPLLGGQLDVGRQTIVCVISGGNLSVELVRELLC